MKNILFLITFILLAGCSGSLREGSFGGPAKADAEGIEGNRPRVIGFSVLVNPDGTVSVTLNGSGFKPGATVTIKNISCTSISVLSSELLTCVLPRAVDFVLTDIEVVNPDLTSGSGGQTCENHPAAAGPPGAARFLSARTAEEGQVTLEWSSPQSGPTPTSYKIYRAVSLEGIDPSGYPYVTVSGLTFTDTAVSNGSRYYYGIVSVTNAGDGELSNMSDAMPIAHTAMAFSANLFVDFNAAAGGNGSYLSPFNSFSAAVTAASTGGTINFFDLTPGQQKTQTSAMVISKSVTLRSLTGDYRNSNVVFAPATPSTSTRAFNIDSSGLNVTIKGLQFTGYNAVGQPTVISTSSPVGSVASFTLSQNRFFDIGTWVVSTASGIEAQGGWTIYGNMVKNISGLATASAFVLWKIPNSVFSYNTIDSVPWVGVSFNSSSGWTISHGVGRSVILHLLSLRNRMIGSTEQTLIQVLQSKSLATGGMSNDSHASQFG